MCGAPLVLQEDERLWAAFNGRRDQRGGKCGNQPVKSTERRVKRKKWKKLERRVKVNGGSSRDKNRVETFQIFREKWKQNEDMETKIELCKTEMETDFFWWKWKWKRNNVFRRNRRGNGISVFD
jgi:hypothetical protein